MPYRPNRLESEELGGPWSQARRPLGPGLGPGVWGGGDIGVLGEGVINHSPRLYQVPSDGNLFWHFGPSGLCE